MNRAVRGMMLFESPGDYDAFERCIEHALRQVPGMRILSYCSMPNHWHLMLWPTRDDQASKFVRLLTVTHATRWLAAHGVRGTGSVYQGRFKSFPIQTDEHLMIACRYVERNALRASLAKRAEEWRWGGAWWRMQTKPCAWLLPLADWPTESVLHVARWNALLNRPQTQREEDEIAASMRRGRPFGSERWQRQIARTHGLASTLKPIGRPRAHNSNSYPK